MLAFINGLLSMFDLTIIGGFAALTVFLTKLIRMLPPEWTTSRPKIVAAAVSFIVVGGVGFYTKADILTTYSVAVATTIGSYGLYDAIVGLWSAFKKVTKL